MFLCSDDISWHMDDKIFVSQLKDGMAVDSCFVIAEKELLDFKSKPGRYLQVKFKDRTGEIWGKCWEEAYEASEKFEIGDVVQVRGNVIYYNGHLQLQFTLHGVQKVENYDRFQFIDSTKQNVNELYTQLRGLTKSFTNIHLKALLTSFFDDPVFEKGFKASPCAKSHHHNFLGGLIDHTFSVTVICRTMVKLYPALDKDLLITGAILHDVGKIESYKVDTLIDLTPEGGLYDHVVMSYEKIKAKIRDQEDFPKDLERRLLHMILSHHGKKEWGSPVVPMTEEACVLSYADLLDSQTSEFLKVKDQLDVNRKSIWSGFSRKLDRFIYLGDENGL